MNNKVMNSILNGSIRAFVFTAILMMAFSIINYFIPSIDKGRNTFILIATLISIMYGAFYASRRYGKKGWLIGVSVAILYILIIYIVSSISGGEIIAINLKAFIKIILAILVGMFSGMLGLNM